MNNKRKIDRLFISVFLAVILITSVFVISPPIVRGQEIIVYSEGFETVSNINSSDAVSLTPQIGSR